MTTRPFFQWCDGLAIANSIRDSRVLFPAIECVHILALTALLGIVLLMSLRLVGIGLRQVPIRDFYQSTARIRNTALVLMLITGFLLFCSEALKCYDLPPFWLKMETLLGAILFDYGVVRRMALRTKPPAQPYAASVGLLSMTLWFGVGIAGRAIGFY